MCFRTLFLKKKFSFLFVLSLVCRGGGKGGGVYKIVALKKKCAAYIYRERERESERTHAPPDIFTLLV